jgi:hypothetical protein
MECKNVLGVLALIVGVILVAMLVQRYMRRERVHRAAVRSVVKNWTGESSDGYAQHANGASSSPLGALGMSDANGTLGQSCGMAPEALGTGWDCNNGACVPSSSACPNFHTAGACINSGCGRMRYRCEGGPGNSTRLVPDPAGEYYSREDGIRDGCGQECTPSNYLGAYVGSEVYFPSCATSSCNGQNEGACNVLKTKEGLTYNQGTIGSCKGYGMSVATGMEESGCNVVGEPLGPCGRGLDSNVLIPADYQSGCAGFDSILIDRPRDLLWANNLQGDCTVLTNTRNQTQDVRGDIPVGAVDGCCDQQGNGNAKPGTGPFCGTQLPSFGPFQQSSQCVRTYVY